MLDREIRVMGQCSRTLLKFLKLDSEFRSRLEKGDLVDVYFFERDIREELMDWVDFCESFIGNEVGYVTGTMLENSLTVDDEIRELLGVICRKVVMISSMNIDREELVVICRERNPFNRYGFYEFGDKLSRLIDVGGREGDCD